MLVASLLDVVRNQQHVGAASPTPATTQAPEHPAQVRRAANALRRSVLARSEPPRRARVRGG